MPPKPILDKMIEMLKNMSLYEEGEDKEAAFKRYRNMSKEDIDVHMSKLRM